MRRKALWALFAFAFTVAPVITQDAPAATSPAEQRVEKLLSQLTTEEKLDLLGGVDDFFTKPIPRLNIPRFKMMDGPVGARNDGPTTAYPAGIALAATWNTELAHAEGSALGKDARARGGSIQLGPGLNIYRIPTCGRNFEYFGEDPFLSSRLAVDFVRGIQGEGVAACVKHFAVNNQEVRRDSINVVVDERALHEIYLPAFKAAVQEGGAWCVMSAYNRVNGPYCTANDYLQNQVLKQQWGFRGLVMSDWGATHETLGCVNGGLDLEMPAGGHLNREKITPLLADGRVKQQTIDDKVRRLLRMAVEMGWLDRPQKPEGVPLNDPANDATALAVASEGIVLLKNDGVLPLDRSKIKQIVLIGPNADPAVTGGGGSSWTAPYQSTSIAKGIAAAFGESAKVTNIGMSSDRLMAMARQQATYEAMPDTDNKPGLHASYYKNIRLRGPAIERNEATPNHDWGAGAPMAGVGPSQFSVRWRGAIKPTVSGSHLFAIRSDDGCRVLLDGKTIIDDWRDHGAYTSTTTTDLTAGKTYDLAIEYYNNAGTASIEFGWCPRPPMLSPEEDELTRKADVVIACIGFNSNSEGEGSDRPYQISGDQIEALNAAAKLNPNIIVVLNAGGGVDMAPWLGNVRALVHAWYPGQEGGKAIARILTGEVNPSGKLPITIEQKWDDLPTAKRYPGDYTTVEYTEGIFVGYRGFDHAKIEPRYPFGFGLSYTTFAFENMSLEPSSADGKLAYNAMVTVRNTGTREGSEVVQVYAAPLDSKIIRPVRELKGFAKVKLQPGESKTVRVTVPRESLAYYDLDQHAWRVEAGRYELQAGDSSRNLPLKAALTAAQ